MTNRIGLSLDPETNDLHLDANGHLVVVTDAHAIGQHVRQRLKTFSGEWFLDTTAGVPWLDEILGRRYDPALAETVTKAEVLDTDGVKEILAFAVSFDQVTRNLIQSGIEVLTVYDQKVVI